MQKKIFILLGLFILLSKLVFADQNWTTWRKPPNILSIAFEDSIIWCGTKGEGVVAYNSKTGEQQFFTTENSSISEYAYSIAVDENGVKWFGAIGSNSGISQFDGSGWILHKIPYCNEIVINHNDVWAATSKGLYTYDGDKWEKVESGEFHSVELSPSGSIWGATDTKIYHLTDANKTEIDIHEIVAARDYIKDIAVDNKTELLWYTCSSKIYTYDWKTGTETLMLNDTVPDYEGYTMIDIDSTGNIWLGRSGYCALYSNGTITNYYDDYFESHTINSIISDGTGNVWIATSQGVLRFDRETLDLEFGEAELYSNQINNIVIDKNDTVWCSNFSTYENGRWRIAPLGIGNILSVTDDGVYWGTYQSKLYSYDGNEIVEHIIKVPIPGFDCETTWPGYISDIYIDNDNIVWIASFNNSTGDTTKSGIFTYNGETVVPIILGDCVSITADSKHNIWFSVAFDGLYKYNSSEMTRFAETEGLPSNRIGNIEIDNNDIVWFSAYHVTSNENYHSFVSFEGTKFTEYSAENSGLPKTLINTLAIDHNNTKWIGTDAGVSRFDGETWTTFTTENSGLCNNKVNAIAVEKNNTIWFGTDNGVSRYTGEVITTSVDEEDETPEALPVLHSYPNPFNPSTTIEFTLPESGFATLSIYNISGQKVRELAADHMTAGMHSLLWDGRDDSGNVVSSGVYITRLEAGTQVAAGRMVLMK